MSTCPMSYPNRAKRCRDASGPSRSWRQSCSRSRPSRSRGADTKRRGGAAYRRAVTREASTARSLANRAAVAGSQERLPDLLNFNRWLEVSTEGNTQLADLYERRFRDEFRPAFTAWLAQDPLNNQSAVASPLLMPQYVLANEVRSDRLETVADRKFADGRDATENADDYIFLTVLFAIVLFFAGISLRFAWPLMRMIVLGIGAAILVYGLVELSLMNTH